MSSALSTRAGFVVLGCALASPALMALGMLSSLTRLLGPFGGFLVFQLGIVSSALAILGGLPAWFCARSSNSRQNRRRPLLGFGVALATLAGIALVLNDSLTKPPINDVTTDLEDPPQFLALSKVAQREGPDMTHPDEFATVQRSAYPMLAPLVVDATPPVALERSRTAASNLGWKIVALDAEGLRLEATDETPLFHFVDDIVVRIRPHPRGARIDVRSKSRLGQGDLGENAARIRRFFAALGGSPQADIPAH